MVPVDCSCQLPALEIPVFLADAAKVREGISCLQPGAPHGFDSAFCSGQPRSQVRQFPVQSALLAHVNTTFVSKPASTGLIQGCKLSKMLVQVYEMGRDTCEWLLTAGGMQSHRPHNQLPKAPGSGISPRLWGRGGCVSLFLMCLSTRVCRESRRAPHRSLVKRTLDN